MFIEIWLKRLFMGLLFLFFPIAFFAPKALVILLMAIGVMSVFRPGFRIRGEGIKQPIAMFLLIFLLYSFLHLIFSGGFDVASQSFKGFAKLLLFIGVGLLIFFDQKGPLETDRAHGLEVVMVGYFASVILLALSYFFGFSYLAKLLEIQGHVLTFFARGASVVALMLVPFSVYFAYKRQKLLALFWIILSFVVLYISGKNTAFLTAIAAIAILPFIYWSAHKMMRLIQIALVVCFMFAPVLVEKGLYRIAQNYEGGADQKALYYINYNSFVHRMHIWHFVADKIHEKPIFGYGMNTSRSIGQDQKIAFLSKGSVNQTFHEIEADALPLHPHNVFLQIWLEFGFIGALLGSFFIFMIFEYALKLKSRAEQMIYLGYLVPVFVVANMSYGIWQGWWLASVILSAIFVKAILKSLSDMSGQK